MNQPAQDAQEVEDDFLALASHQLRTPATGVKQYVGMLLEGFAGPLTDVQMKLLNKAYKSNERQLGIINEMLFVARADTGQLKIQKEPVDMTGLIRDIVEEQHQAISNKNQTCRLDAPDEELQFAGDEQYLRMAIENLVSNATKYTREGGHIDITLDSDKKNLHLTIEDTGVGVSEEDKKLLFKKFSRIPNDLSALVSGSGLGLYLVKKVVEAHSGTVVFDSELNVGSSVKITLPMGK